MLATWCSVAEEYTEKQAKKYKQICFAFDLPYMPTMEHYQQLLIRQGFIIDKTLDWTHYVKKSWDIGISILNAFSFCTINQNGRMARLRFAKQIKLMQEAFNQQNIKYGVFIAIKPEPSK